MTGGARGFLNAEEPLGQLAASTRVDEPHRIII